MRYTLYWYNCCTCQVLFVKYSFDFSTFTTLHKFPYKNVSFYTSHFLLEMWSYICCGISDAVPSKATLTYVLPDRPPVPQLPPVPPIQPDLEVREGHEETR